LVIAEVTKIFPHFKKLKPRLFEFGYKIFTYEEHNSIFMLSRSMTNLPLESKKSFRDMETAESIDVDDLIFKMNDSTRSNQYLSFQTESTVKETLLLERKLNIFIDGFIASHSKEIIICSDGSALLNGKRCVDATAGLIISFPTNSSSKFDAANMFTVKVENAGGMVLTPFDAELLAGLAALSLARIIVDSIIARNVSIDSSHKSDLKVTLLTDSRTLLRSVRIGEPPNVNYTTCNDADLTFKSSRRSLFDLFSTLIKHTNLKGRNTVITNNFIKCLDG